MPNSETTSIDDPIGPFWRWEQLRIPYNLVLLALVVAYLTLVNPERLSEPQFQATLLHGAVLLNVAFLLGFVLESFFAVVGLSSVWLTTILFLAGLFLSSFLTLITLFSFEFQRAFS